MLQRYEVAGTTGRINSQYKHVESVFIAVLCPPRHVSVQLAAPTYWNRHCLHAYQKTWNIIVQFDVSKGPFIATQLNSTPLDVELS